jgi:hypothetical protein
VARTDLLAQIEAGTPPPIVDVRTDAEDTTSHVPGAVHIPFYTMLIGHSFGGLIAFQANSQSFALRYGSGVLANRGGPLVPGLGDLVVLINPAIEATRFTSLHSLWSEYPNDPSIPPSWSPLHRVPTGRRV